MTLFFKDEQIEDQPVSFGQGPYHLQQDLLGNVINRELFWVIFAIFFFIILVYRIMESPFSGLNEL